MRTMKDSGIEWIGEIPESWDIVRLKAVFNFGKGLPITKENLVEQGIPVISYGQIHAKFNNGVSIDDRLLRFVPESYLETNPSSLVTLGDILVADTSEDLDGCGNAVQVDREMSLFAGYHTIILQSIESRDNKYLAYTMRTDHWRSQLRGKASGVKVFSISKKMLGDCLFIYPTPEEQESISAYLDRQCAHIDNIIEKTKASIEEYKKLRQAVITQAVTKGVRGERAMKDSGIEWIGEIPEEWHLVKITRLLDYNHPYPIGDGDHGLIKTDDYMDAGIPYLRVQNLGWGTSLLLENVVFISEKRTNKSKTVFCGQTIFYLQKQEQL